MALKTLTRKQNQKLAWINSLCNCYNPFLSAIYSMRAEAARLCDQRKGWRPDLEWSTCDQRKGWRPDLVRSALEYLAEEWQFLSTGGLYVEIFQENKEIGNEKELANITLQRSFWKVSHPFICTWAVLHLNKSPNSHYLSFSKSPLEGILENRLAN